MEIIISLTEKEYDAVIQYSKLCNEDPASLIPKIIMHDIAFLKGDLNIPENYEYSLKVPDGLSPEEEEKIMSSYYNKIRDILGIRSLRL